MKITAQSSAERQWLLLLFFLPTKQAHARVQAWRRLQRIGAVLLKNSAYALPLSAESREDFEWIKNDIVASGGQAIVLVARAPDRAGDDEIVGAFRHARRHDFEALKSVASTLLKRASGTGAARARRQLTQRARRLRERFEEIVRLDFFGTAERDQVAVMLATLDQRTGRTRMTTDVQTTKADRNHYRKKTWVTRPRPGVDRMSSAWLIRRFIDGEATFAFADPATMPRAIPFDTFEAEFGHHGTRCTFETFCARFGIDDPAVRRIGQMVHDLDLKEAKPSAAETATIGRLVEGLRRAQPDDHALLRSGIEMFEALYQSMAQVAPTARARRRRRAGS